MDPAAGAAVFVLREREAPNRLLPIIVGGAEASSIAMAVGEYHVERPMTHDLLATLVDSLDAHVDAAEATELRDGSYLANSALSGPIGERRLDTRPSDAIALAIRLNAPLYASEGVLDDAGTLPIVEFGDDEIEAEIDGFRDFLAELDPADFISDFPPPTGSRMDKAVGLDEIDGKNPEDWPDDGSLRRSQPVLVSVR
jgi:uncharacterized protein